jgi:hypothetical protein
MAEQVASDSPESPVDTPAEVPRWLDDLRPGAEGEGFFEKNLRHSLMFVKRPSDRLLVTFDNLSIPPLLQNPKVLVGYDAEVV